MTILTLKEASELLKMSEQQVYNLTRSRSAKRLAKPIPVIRILRGLRFDKESLEAWLREMEER